MSTQIPARSLLAALFIFYIGSAIAAGGSSMGGTSMPSTPQKTPQQLAVEHYNAGLKYRETALELTTELATAETEKDKKKLEKKIAKQYERAAKKFRSAIKQVPLLYQAHGSLGYALKQLGKFDEAMAAYNEALRLRPEYTPAIEYRAEAYLALGQYDGVITAHGLLVQFDADHQAQLELAIHKWLKANKRDETNAPFYDWATALDSLPSDQASVAVEG